MNKRRLSDGGLVLALCGTPLLLVLFIPLAALVLGGSSALTLEVLTRPETATALWLSLRTTFLSLLFIVIFGTPLAFWVARGSTGFHRAIELLCELPIVLPPAAAGIALLLAFGRSGWLNLGVSFTAYAVVLAQIFVAAPLYMRACVNAFNEQPHQMFDVAAADGAWAVQLFMRIAIPVSGRALIAGAMIAWARAVGEFGATIIFAGNFPGRTQTVPLAIYLGFESDFRQAQALAIILLVFALLALSTAHLLLRARRNDWV